MSGFRWLGLTAMLLVLRGAGPAAAEPVETNLLPNGGFEFWSRALPRRQATPRLMPPAPLRWDVSTRGTVTLEPSPDARSGRQAARVHVRRGSVQLTMRFLEVYPGATYRYGVWVKGRGDVTVRVNGVVMEGWQALAQARGSAGEAWTHIGGELTVPRHVLDRIELTLDVGGAGDLRLDDAHVSARLDAPFDADAVLRDKLVRDAQTLFFEDFEDGSDGFRLEGTSESGVTGPDGGRFGHGLRMQRPGLAVFPLTIDRMPREGTLEWWITLDAFEKVTFLQVVSGSGQVMARFRGVAMIWCQLPGVPNMTVPEALFGEQAREGQWVHVAVTWDEHYYRVYLNGVLALRSSGAPNWPAAPATIQVGDARQSECWNGRIDALRLSSVRRYAAPVPAGFVPFPPLKPETAAEADAASTPTAAPPREYDARALRSERLRLPPDAPATRPGAFETTPDATGAYIYEATSLRALIEGGAALTWTTHAPSGLVSARIPSIRRGEAHYYKDSDGARWTLGALPADEYWLELWARGAHAALYHNGRIVQMESATDGVRTGRDSLFTPLRSVEAVRVRSGDTIALQGRARRNSELEAARLILRRDAPPAGRHYVAPHYDPHTGGPDTALAVTGQVLFHDASGRPLPGLLERDGGRNQRAEGPDALETAADGRPAVRCEIFNPLPTAVEVEYDVVLRSYYRLPVGGARGRIRIEPHTSWRQRIPFDALPDERAFSAQLSVKVVEPKDAAAWRAAMRWPDLDWIAFFPGMRQGLPWPEIFEDVDLRRLEFEQPVRSVRRTILLSGDAQAWQRAFTADWQATWPTDEVLEWEPGGPPMHSRNAMHQARRRNPPAHAMILRRTFTLPAQALEESCEIILESTSHEAALFVNDVEVGRVRGGNTPLQADITPAARPGENDLVIVVRNALAIMNPDYINPNAPDPNLQYLDAPGDFRAWGLGVGDVSLNLSPRVSARRLQVVSSTREGTLRARCEVVNHRDRPHRLTVRARVFDAAQPVFELGEQAIEVAPGARVALAFDKPWPDARRWWPCDPHLYVMQVEIFDAVTGERLDRLRERFGFRESWIDGPRMMFNDRAIRPKGSALGYRERPNHFARGVDGSGGPDWCDERGMLGGTYITQLSNTSSRHNVERDAFWEAAEQNAIRAAWRRINSPSVARWDMSNEWLKFLSGGDPRQGAQRFKQLSDMVRAFDPTRWTTFGAEGDVHGRMDHFNFHYMSPYFQNISGRERMRGVHAYFPDGEFWRELSRDDIPAEGVRLCPLRGNVILTPREKMILDREFLWKTGRLMPPGTAEYLGENIIAGSDWDTASGPALWMWKQKMDGHRDLGVALINTYTHPGLRRRAHALQTFIVPEVQHHGFGGRTIERRYAVLQDRFRTCDMTFRWTLRGPDGKRIDGGEDRQRMTSGTTHRGVLRVTLPEVEARTVCTLTLALESDGEIVMVEERDLAVWPDVPVTAGPLERRVLLFDARRPTPDARPGSTAAALEAAGVAFERIADLATPDPRPPTPDALLIIAEDALDETNRLAVARLGSWVERGGRILILRQRVTPSGLPAQTSIDTQHWASQAYIRAGNHPVVQGWTDWDFHFWADDRAVVRGAYRKPAHGPVTPIIDSGESENTPRGLEWTGLMEQYRGQGLYLLCQMPLIAKYDEEPMARELLARLIAYGAAATAMRAPRATLRVVSSPTGPMAMRLEAVGARFETTTRKLQTGTSPRLVDAAAARALSSEDRDALAHSLRAGATVTVAEAGPEDAAWLNALADRKIEFTVPPYEPWDGRGLRVAWTQLTAGLSHLDQYWKRFEGHQSARGQAEETRFVIEPFQNYAAWAEGEDVVESVWPGGLVEIPVGRGRLVLDQRNLYTGHEDLRAQAQRVVSALVLGMGGRIDPPAPRRDISPEADPRPVDLSAFANRFLTDEPGRSEGWIGQGADADLRSFPTRNLRFGGIPFELPAQGPQVVAVSRPDGPLGGAVPESVRIPLGHGVDGLYFLHAAAGLEAGWGGEYRIEYEDGTDRTLRLEHGAQIRDWTQPGSLRGGGGARATVAWTGSTARHPLVGIYRLAWANPWPERSVAAVELHAPEGHHGTLLLLALTAAVGPDAPAAPEPQPAGDPDGARRRAEAAAAALREGDDARANMLAAEALTLYNQSEGAHAVLADLAEKAGTEDRQLAVYRAWIAAGTENPRPYNGVGAILERRQDWRGARDAYARSLELEWNQPPIIEAQSRVERQVP